MGITMKKINFWKRKKEVIDIHLPEIPITKNNPNVKDDEIYSEEINYDGNQHSLDDCFTSEEKVSKISDNMASYDKKSDALLHQYYFLKLFSKVASKDREFNLLMFETDKQINRLRRNHENLKKKFDVMKYIDNPDMMDIDEIFSKLNELFDFYREINKRLNGIQRTYYSDLKMASYSICNDKNYMELDKLNRNVNNMLEEYKSLQEAHDYIYYHSGELIVNTINSLVECFQKSNNSLYVNTYDYNYFLESDVIITFNYVEWVNLFNKIRYVKRTTNNIELFDYLKFANYYSELEKYYLIVLIYNETNKNM